MICTGHWVVSGKTVLGKPRRRWKDNIEMDVTEHVIRTDFVQWRAVVMVV
jgi:hypothetical protein